MSKLWKPDNAGKVIQVVRVHPLLPPPPQAGVRLQPQHLHWQLGRYVEDLSFGPGGRGKRRRWVVDMEAEQHNLILDQAYDTLIAQHGFVYLNNYAVVGTGSTPPATTQTGLANEIRRTIRDETGDTSGTRTITRVSDGTYEILVVREFTEAEVGNTNVTEWGFSPVSTSSNNLMSRELFRDGNGNPVVITPASDQRLRLIYKISVSITPITATAHSITIENIGTRTGFVCVSRGGMCDGTADLTIVDNFARGNGTWPYPVRMALFSGASFVPGYTTYMELHTWSSSVAAKNVSAFVPYTPGSRTRLIPAMTWDANEANFTIRGVVLAIPCDPYIIPSFYVVFSDGQEFTKTNLYKLTIGPWTLTWGP